jgi:hypothetical protein
MWMPLPSPKRFSFEETYSNPAHWDQNGGHHQTERVAWEILGTEDRMAHLQTLIEQAEELALTAPEQARVAFWKTGVWDYMVEGRRAYLKKAGAQSRKEAFPEPGRDARATRVRRGYGHWIRGLG